MRTRFAYRGCGTVETLPVGCGAGCQPARRLFTGAARAREIQNDQLCRLNWVFLAFGACSPPRRGGLGNPPQVGNLPHKAVARGKRLDSVFSFP